MGKLCHYTKVLHAYVYIVYQIVFLKYLNLTILALAILVRNIIELCSDKYRAKLNMLSSMKHSKYIDFRPSIL